MAHAHEHYHEKMAELARRQNGVSVVGGTVYSVVYVTAQPTFTGVIGGYTTLTSASAQASLTAASVNSGGANSPSLEFSTAPTETVVAQDSSTSKATLISPATTSANVVSTRSQISGSSTATGSVAPASATTGSSSSDSSSSNSGMSTGAKAGIAIGVIGAVGLFAILLLWLLGKKRKAREAQANKDNEKSTYDAGAATEMVNRSPPAGAAAPRLSLRPVSRMLPEFMGTSSKGRLSGGNLLNTIGESGSAPSRNLSPSPRGGPSPTPQRAEVLNSNDPFADPQNPFADPEKHVQAPAPVATAPNAAASASVAPSAGVAAAARAAAETKPKPTPASEPEKALERALAPASTSGPAPTPTSVGGAIQAEPIPQEASSTAPSTPVAPAPAAPVAAGTEPPVGNVYRVLMDFKPSMDDELELKNGQLVRLLHEYDDGWVRLNFGHRM